MTKRLIPNLSLAIMTASAAIVAGYHRDMLLGRVCLGGSDDGVLQDEDCRVGCNYSFQRFIKKIIFRNFAVIKS